MLLTPLQKEREVPVGEISRKLPWTAHMGPPRITTSYWMDIQRMSKETQDMRMWLSA